MTKFKDFMKEIEAEAEAEGPEAVAQLRALCEHYVRLREIADTIAKTEASGDYDVAEHLSGSVNPEPLRPVMYNGWGHHPACIGMAEGKGTGYCSELGCDIPPGTPKCSPDPIPETTIEALRLIALLVPHGSQSYEIAVEHIKRLDSLNVLRGGEMPTFGIVQAWAKEYDVIVPGPCENNAYRELASRIAKLWGKDNE